MIGGIEIRLPTKAGQASIEVAVRAIRQRWPCATFENALAGESYATFWQIPFGGIQELFVYRDSDCASQWDAEGAVPAVYNTMVHLLHDDDLLTVVVDERSDAMNELLGAIQSGLGDEILYLLVEREAA